MMLIMRQEYFDFDRLRLKPQFAKSLQALWVLPVNGNVNRRSA